MKRLIILSIGILNLFVISCNNEKQGIKMTGQKDKRIPVLLDTDANNELDDQHALAYLFFNGDVFDLRGITVNKTKYGGDINQHYAEAKRVAKMCNVEVDVYKGATKDFKTIRKEGYEDNFDGHEAVNFIIEQAKLQQGEKLLVLPIGKLTNVALALEKAPEIIPNIKVMWLGSNYPDPGEYNQINDLSSLAYVLETEVEFEIVTVGKGKPSGTDAVHITLEEVRTKVAGKGPVIDPPVVGRHEKQFSNFGDYSLDLFSNIKLYGDPPSRALYDMVAIAVAKDPTWGVKKTVPRPRLEGRNWVAQPENTQTIVIWENFDKEKIFQDFYHRLENYVLTN